MHTTGPPTGSRAWREVDLEGQRSASGTVVVVVVVVAPVTVATSTTAFATFAAASVFVFVTSVFVVAVAPVVATAAGCCYCYFFFWGGSLFGPRPIRYSNPYAFTLLLFAGASHHLSFCQCTHRSTFKLSAALPSRKAHLFLPKGEPTFCATHVGEITPLYPPF